MTYTPGAPASLPMVIPSFFGNVSLAASSAAYEEANRAVYMPIITLSTCVVRRLWWANGATVSASYSLDCGIYADAGYKPGALIVSTGSTAQGTASEIQFVDCTDTTLAPGRYWIALACTSTSATVFRAVAQTSMDASLRFQEASAVPLPATATVAEGASGNIYLCGFATTASP